MKIGALSKRITLQSPTNAADGMGGVTTTWANEEAVWAGIWPISANETLQGNAPAMSVTHRIRIRYYSGLLPSWRICFGTRYFNIVSIINPDERNEMQDILAKELI